jgi:hypothetical protein
MIKESSIKPDADALGKPVETIEAGGLKCMAYSLGRARQHPGQYVVETLWNM